MLTFRGTLNVRSVVVGVQVPVCTEVLQVPLLWQVVVTSVLH